MSVNPGYDEATIGWDPKLVGAWVDADDGVTLQIERGEWKSYRIHYIHPIETGDLTGYLTAIGNERYLDVMPARGEDRGSFLLPAPRDAAPAPRRRSSRADAALLRVVQRTAAGWPPDSRAQR